MVVMLAVMLSGAQNGVSGIISAALSKAHELGHSHYEASVGHLSQSAAVLMLEPALGWQNSLV
jgi:hypothetical protein